MTTPYDDLPREELIAKLTEAVTCYEVARKLVAAQRAELMAIKKSIPMDFNGRGNRGWYNDETGPDSPAGFVECDPDDVLEEMIDMADKALALTPDDVAGKVLVDAKDVRELEDLRFLANMNWPFQEWAQSYLDCGRWAGHHYGDAVKTELLERDADLATALARVEALERDGDVIWKDLLEWKRRSENQAATIEQLQSALLAAKADGERIDWLEKIEDETGRYIWENSEPKRTEPYPGGFYQVCDSDYSPSYGKTFREAIDAAMTAPKRAARLAADAKEGKP